MDTADDEERLIDAAREIAGWLRLKRSTGRFSIGFVHELAQHYLSRGYNVHAIFDEIGRLEGTEKRPSRTKAAKEFTQPPLLGYWHKHWFEARFIAHNVHNAMTKPILTSIISRNVVLPPEQAAAQIADEVVRGGFNSRATNSKLTGEFIVFQRRADCSNYYLTLGKHGDYDAIADRINAYMALDQKYPPPNT